MFNTLGGRATPGGVRGELANDRLVVRLQPITIALLRHLKSSCGSALTKGHVAFTVSSRIG
jgi:hypothetical protein